jgi:hypothetical protein
MTIQVFMQIFENIFGEKTLLNLMFWWREEVSLMGNLLHLGGIRFGL